MANIDSFQNSMSYYFVNATTLSSVVFEPGIKRLRLESITLIFTAISPHFKTFYSICIPRGSGKLKPIPRVLGSGFGGISGSILSQI